MLSGAVKTCPQPFRQMPCNHTVLLAPAAISDPCVSSKWCGKHQVWESQQQEQLLLACCLQLLILAVAIMPALPTLQKKVCKKIWCNRKKSGVCHLQIHSLWPMDHWLKLPAKLAANIRPLRSMQLLGGQIFKRRILMMLLHGWNFEIFESWGFARPGVVIMSKLAAPLRVLQWSNMTVQLATSIGKGTCVSVRVVKLSWDLGHFVRWNLKFERLQDSTCEPDQFERFVRGWSSMKKAWWLGKHPQVNCVGLLRAAS